MWPEQERVESIQSVLSRLNPTHRYAFSWMQRDILKNAENGELEREKTGFLFDILKWAETELLLETPTS